MKARVLLAKLLALLLALHAAPALAATVVRLGTIAPDGSVWHDVLLEIAQRWRELSNGEVELRIYAGGVLGGEDEMVRKMQRRGLDALAVSGSGLPRIDPVVGCLNLPLLFESYEELEHVRNGIAPRLEASFEARGYKVLNWAEAGWVHIFAKSPVRTPDDLRSLRLWTSAGDPGGERLARELGFRVVPLPATDMLTSLQTGLIEAIDVPPLFALLDRSYQAAPYMTDLQFAPLNAATVITLPAWERIPAPLREPLLAAAREAAVPLRERIHQAEREAVEEMVARGLTVVELDAAARAAWRRMADSAYERLDCAREYPQLYERVLELRREYRSSGGASD
ncbi:MAG TPA: TRAP transporter substrate-binding protein DctP [Gammaproteobacteria bacterium]